MSCIFIITLLLNNNLLDLKGKIFIIIKYDICTESQTRSILGTLLDGY